MEGLGRSCYKFLCEERGSSAFLEQLGCVFIAAGPASFHMDGVGRPASEEQKPPPGPTQTASRPFQGNRSP